MGECYIILLILLLRLLLLLLLLHTGIKRNLRVFSSGLTPPSHLLPLISPHPLQVATNVTSSPTPQAPHPLHLLPAPTHATPYPVGSHSCHPIPCSPSATPAPTPTHVTPSSAPTHVIPSSAGFLLLFFYCHSKSSLWSTLIG
jgi:hypothetical protein